MNRLNTYLDHDELIEREQNILFNTFNKSLLTRKETAKVLSISLATLDRFRSKFSTAIGPRFIKGTALNSSVMYPISAIAEWIVTTMCKGL